MELPSFLAGRNSSATQITKAEIQTQIQLQIQIQTEVSKSKSSNESLQQRKTRKGKASKEICVGNRKRLQVKKFKLWH